VLKLREGVSGLECPRARRSPWTSVASVTRKLHQDAWAPLAWCPKCCGDPCAARLGQLLQRTSQVGSSPRCRPAATNGTSSRCPALAEENDPLGRAPGEPLWPEWEDLESLERKRPAVGARDWSALYQQRPAPEGGDYFKADWLKPYERARPRHAACLWRLGTTPVTADGLRIPARDLPAWRHAAASLPRLPASPPPAASRRPPENRGYAGDRAEPIT
jgi:hypothetical protein